MEKFEFLSMAWMLNFIKKVVGRKHQMKSVNIMREKKRPEVCKFHND